eukprot:6695806-Ditylum_brightwellii.AAC.1
MCTGITPIKLFESEFIKLDGTIADQSIAVVICGGVFKDKNQDKALIIPWSGTGPDRYHVLCQASISASMQEKSQAQALTTEQ